MDCADKASREVPEQNIQGKFVIEDEVLREIIRTNENKIQNEDEINPDERSGFFIDYGQLHDLTLTKYRYVTLMQVSDYNKKKTFLRKVSEIFS